MKDNYYRHDTNNTLTAPPPVSFNPVTAPLILLVEDQPLLQLVHSSCLKDLGLQVRLAKSGKEALMQLDPSLALIVMDIGLPDMSGIDVIKSIRAQQCYQTIPIITLTSYPKEMIEQDCLRAGCDAVLSKPIAIPELQKFISQHLTKIENH